MAEQVFDENDVREIVRQVMNGKVVYRDTCKTQHEGDAKMMTEVKDKVKILDGRLWALIVMAFFQLVSVIVMLLKITPKGG